VIQMARLWMDYYNENTIFKIILQYMGDCFLEVMCICHFLTNNNRPQ